MAPLKVLERDYPLIDSNFQKFCASHGIFTVEDFLIEDLYVLAALSEHDYSSDKLKQGITQVLSILDNHHRPWLNGLKLLEDSEQNKCVSTGWERIDDLLQGGLLEGHVTELVGPPSSGKTQICLQAASHVARKYSGTVMYLDSGNSFSPKRIAQFLRKSLDPAITEVNQILQSVMGSIVHHSTFDIFSLLDILHQLLHNFKYQVRMLIIDSLSSLIAPVLGSGGAQGHALMVTAGFLLKELANEHNLSVVVTNHMVAGESGSSKPALGESWKTIPHIRLLLSRCRATNISSLSILKHPILVPQENKLVIPICSFILKRGRRFMKESYIY